MQTVRVQNGRMTRTTLAVLAAAVLVLAGCTSDDEPDADSSPDASAAADYLPVPDGVELTTPGSELEVGDDAVVAYEPRQDQVAALDIRVRQLEQASIRDLSSWQLSAAQQKSTPYYVTAKVENVGDSDVGGRPVPLYVVNEDDVLLESTPFASSFKPCPSTPFPEKFKPGDSATVCLVYLAPKRGKLVAVSFRPDETFDPITWTGEVQKPEKPQQDKKGQGKKDKKGEKGTKDRKPKDSKKRDRP